MLRHHHRRKLKDVHALRHTYSIGAGDYKVSFLLFSETRPTYLRARYWRILRTARRRYGFRDFLWEVRGAVSYLMWRLRKRLAGIGNKKRENRAT